VCVEVEIEQQRQFCLFACWGIILISVIMLPPGLTPYRNSNYNMKNENEKRRAKFGKEISKLTVSIFIRDTPW